MYCFLFLEYIYTYDELLITFYPPSTIQLDSDSTSILKVHYKETWSYFLSWLTMIAIRSLTLLASALLGFTAAAPTKHEARQTWVPGTLNNTQEFYLHMTVTDGPTKYNGWACKYSHPDYYSQNLQYNSRGIPHRSWSCRPSLREHNRNPLLP